jgi:hypothetical protein
MAAEYGECSVNQLSQDDAIRSRPTIVTHVKEDIMVPREALTILRRMEIAVTAGALEKALDLQKHLHSTLATNTPRVGTVSEQKH